MNIEIRRLTPDLAEDYVHFFDVTPHNVNTDSGKCYCVTWRSDNSYVGNGDHWFPSSEERREHATCLRACRTQPSETGVPKRQDRVWRFCDCP